MIKLIAAYSKKIGLPGYSSHSFSVSLETELNDVENVASESERLYAVLQENVDKQIQQTGFVPPAEYGMGNGNHTNGGQHQQRHQQNGNAGITEPQLDLINKIVREHNLSKTKVDDIAVEMFGGGVRTLNRMQASNFIDELFERYPRKNGNGDRRRYKRQQTRSQ